MPDNETPDEEAIEVTVTVPDDSANEPVEEPDTTVVVVEDSPDAPVEVVIDHAERLAVLERENEELRAQIAEAQFTADMAESTAEVAIDVAIDAAEESAEADEEIIDAVDETVDDLEDEINDELDSDDSLLGNGDSDEEPIDVAPASARVHPFFRSFQDWRNGN